MKKTIQAYLDNINNKKNNYDYVVIYGAGRKAISLYRYLKDIVKINAFVVTNKDENKEHECGIPIYGINEISFPSQNTLILIGVRQRWNQDVIRKLIDFGYTSYIEAPEGIEYLGVKDADRSKRSVLQLTLQIGCAINCKYCPQSLFINQYKKNAERENRMDYDLFVRYLENIEREVILEFAGFSEPFLNKDCVRMLEYAHHRGHEIELFTTLQGLHKGELKRVLNIPYREVVLHIPDEENNSKIDVNEDYLYILERLINARKVNGDSFVDWGSCHGEPSSKVNKIVGKNLRLLTQLHDRAGNLDFNELERKRDIKGKIQCSGTLNFDHNVLLPDGTVLLCDSDWGMRHPIGNLKNQTYQEIITGSAVSEIKEKMIDEKKGDLLCRSCCYAVACKD